MSKASFFFRFSVLSLALTLVAADALQAQDTPAHFDLLIRGGRVIDGSGNPWFPADVGVVDGRIAAVGPLDGATADEIIDATGKMVTPGFIDIHSHGGEGTSLVHEDARYRAAPNMVSQGVTTLVVNHDGRSPWPIADQRSQMETLGIGPNALLLVGHGQVRSRVMGNDFLRPASEAEVEEMSALVRQAMNEGAFGMSAAHEYSPAIWSETEEIVNLVAEIGPWDGVYVVHERSSGAVPMWWWPSQDDPGAPTMLDAVAETIEIAERTGVTSVQTHIKARGANFWGSGTTLIQMIERARSRGVNVWADAYPYNTTGSDGNTRLIPNWAVSAGDGRGQDEPPNFATALRATLADEEAADKLRGDIRHEMLRRGDAENILVLDYPQPSYIGKTLQELADERGVDPVEMAIALQLEGDPTRRGGARLRGFSLSEIDVENFYAQPWVMTASDAGITLPGDGFVHPRFYGTFPRRIRHYAINRGIGSVADAVRSMTSLPAQVLGLGDRGSIRVGNHADLVIFDLETLRDTAEPLDPHQYAEGVEQVILGGEFLVRNGELTWALPGSVITPETRGR